jgi:cell division protein FtsN
MSIKIKCECGKTLKVSDEHAGKRGKCPSCGNTMLIPKPEQESLAFEQEQTLQDMEQGEGLGPPMETDSAFLGKEEDEDIGEEWRSYEKKDKLGRRRIKNTILMLLIVAIIGLGALFVLRPWEKKEEPPYSYKTEGKKDIKPEMVSEKDLIRESIEKKALSKSDDTPKPLTETRLETKEEPKPKPSIEPISKVKSQLEIEKKDKIQTQTSMIKPPMPASGGYTVNVASFNKRQSAEKYLAELDKQGLKAFIWSVDLPEKGTWYRVAIGKFLSYKEAQSFQDELQKELDIKPYITRIPSKDLSPDQG